MNAVQTVIYFRLFFNVITKVFCTNSYVFHFTGSITMEEILSVLPFGGTFDLVQLKGSTLKKAFEHSVHRYGGMSGEFLQVSGPRLSGSSLDIR